MSIQHSNKKILKVGLVGAGARFKNFFLPVLNGLSHSIRIEGIVTKSGKVTGEIDSKVPVYQSIELLCIHHEIDFLLIVAKATANYTLCKEAIDLRKNILVETPVSLNWKKIRSLAKLAKKNEVTIAVAEGWPFLPMEKFKRELLKSDLFSDIYMVENDFRTYDYHGIAQLRRYLPTELPLKDSRIIWVKHKVNNKSKELWRIVYATFKNGIVLLSKHNGKRLDIRATSFRSLRIYSRKASLVAGCLGEEEPKILTYQDSSKITHTTTIQVEYDKHSIIEKISAKLIDIGSIEWKNPYTTSSFNEHQIAIAYHLESFVSHLKYGGDVLYPLEEHMKDIRMVTQRVSRFTFFNFTN